MEGCLMNGYFNSHRALLAVAFPPQDGLNGATTTVADLASSDYRRPHLMSRTEAFHHVIGRNLEPVITGSGNKAARREALARMPREELREEDVDVLAERYSEGRTHRREFATNIQD
jgi:hypothetical protein